MPAYTVATFMRIYGADEQNPICGKNFRVKKYQLGRMCISLERRYIKQDITTFSSSWRALLLFVRVLSLAALASDQHAHQMFPEVVV